MRLTGIEKLEFGVEDPSLCSRFIRDFGLSPVNGSDRLFQTLSGAQVAFSPLDNPDLPAAFEAGSTLRRVTWGVKDAAALAAVAQKMRDQPSYQERGAALVLHRS